ncbi:transposase [Aliikangiella sp. IMCC44632]
MSKRMNESQIVAILKEAEAGMLVKDICRKYNIGNSTFYKWREVNNRTSIFIPALCYTTTL